MTIVYAERVKETTSNKPASSATAFNLGGARTGFRGFVVGIAAGSRCVYCAQEVDANGNPAGAWEIAVGTVTDATPDTLSREYLIASSSGSFIDWSATGEDSSPDVFIVDHAAVAPACGISPVNADTRWFHPWHPASAPSGINGNNAATFFWVLDVPQPALIHAMRCSISTGVASSLVRLAAYDDRGGKPYKRLFEDTVDTSSSGLKTTDNAAVLFPGGRLWLAIQASSNSLVLSGISGSPGVTVGGATIYGPQQNSFGSASLGFRCTTQGYADGMLDPWNEALTHNDNAAGAALAQVQLEYL